MLIKILHIFILGKAHLFYFLGCNLTVFFPCYFPYCNNLHCFHPNSLAITIQNSSVERYVSCFKRNQLGFICILPHLI